MFILKVEINRVYGYYRESQKRQTGQQVEIMNLLLFVAVKGTILLQLSFCQLFYVDGL